MATKKAAPKKAMKKAAPKKAAKPMMRKSAAPPMAATSPSSMGGSAPMMMMKKGGKKTMKKAQNGDSLSVSSQARNWEEERSKKKASIANEWYKDKAKSAGSTGYKAPAKNPMSEMQWNKMKAESDKKKRTSDAMKKLPGAKKGTTMKKCKYGC